MNGLDILRTRQALFADQLTQQFGSAAEQSPGITPRSASPPPLSFCQEQVWLHAQLAPDNPAYNESFAISYRGNFDVSAFEKALSEIIRRHEAWRTSFAVENGQPVQIIQVPSSVSLHFTDLRDLPVADRESEILRLAGEEARRPFDLSRGPLLRFKLVRMSDTEHTLLLTLHHIVSDSISIYGIFLPELVTLYEAFATGKSSPLPELSIQYADFCQWQREQWQQGRWAEQ
jgi:Condensation domain